jgi:hypothetical protein
MVLGMTRPVLFGIAFAAVLLLPASGATIAQDHDLVIQDAPNIESASTTTPSDRRSPDIKIGADFSDTSVPDIVRRGIENEVYARFYVNGIDDYTLPSGAVKIRFHYRPAALGDPKPSYGPEDPASDWVSIGELSATYGWPDVLLLTTVWPDDFSTAGVEHVVWDAPSSGEHFQVRAEAFYPEALGVSDVHPEDNAAVSLYESVSGLIDLVLVHDTSGSMGYFSYESWPYINLAKSKAQSFIAALSDTDRFGVVEFSSRFASGYQDVWAPSGALHVASPSNKAAANAAIAGLTASGGTPMGAGLQRAIDLLVAPVPGGAPRKKVILLLSDGYENWGVPRACDGPDSTEPCVGADILAQLDSNDIRVYSLALGLDAWTLCLECLADQSSGHYWAVATPGVEMAEVYLQMQQDYTGDDLYSVDYGIIGGGDDSYRTEFEGAGDVLYFVLAWDDLETGLGLQLRAPGGDWIDARRLEHADVLKGAGYFVARIADADVGEWGYRVIGKEGSGYLAAVRSDRVGLRLTLDVRSKGTVGDSIEIAARLTRSGQPITDAELSATVHVPEGASVDSTLRQLGRDYLVDTRRLPIDSAGLKSNPDVSTRAAFVKEVTGGEPWDVIRTRPVSVPLAHQGDGVYTGVLADANRISGTYSVTVAHEGGGHARTQTRQVRLGPGPVDNAKSNAEIYKVAAATGQVRWLLRAYPADRFGNAVTDAALLDGLSAEIRGGRLEADPQIAFDGALEQEVMPQPGRVPSLRGVALAGRPILVGPIDVSGSQAPSAQGAGPRFILLLIGLILIGFWLRRSGAI